MKKDYIKPKITDLPNTKDNLIEEEVKIMTEEFNDFKKGKGRLIVNSETLYTVYQIAELRLEIKKLKGEK